MNDNDITKQIRMLKLIDRALLQLTDTVAEILLLCLCCKPVVTCYACSGGLGLYADTNSIENNTERHVRQQTLENSCE